MFSIIQFLKYLIRSFHLHGIHSPFIFDLNDKVIQANLPYYSFDAIESIRAKLLLTNKEIEVLDLGAGSKKGNKQKRKINEIAKSAVKKPKYAQLIFRLVYEFKPKTIVELGTSFGITTAYMAHAASNSKIYTLEGSPEIAKVAKINFEKLNIKNINQIVGNFNDTLPELLKKTETLDFVYFDGNHQEKPTIDYFQLCLEKANENSVFIFDDIYWSKGMKMAWEFIKKHPKVTVSIDLFQIGIVFFKQDQEKQNFTIYH
ncbi:MAG: SAM-dependent methyltransferase [Bacteroidetes bacterium]|nr:MAG: SAM-dependent methyltransferase [Bacteroidota bacterium]MBL1144039.1 SAM-dependent methyltransferase [Bacteroidota bacterium]NOG56839.1 SAM-dependent methyltransferase [Bacteroidota bacterium]